MPPGAGITPTVLSARKIWDPGNETDLPQFAALKMSLVSYKCGLMAVDGMLFTACQAGQGAD